MTKFGRYEVVDVVSLTAGGSVSTARLDGRGPIAFAVKRFQCARADPDEPQWDSQLFLDRARLQRSVAAAGARYWLPIRDMGAVPDGAWFVTDYHPLSAQKLIQSRMNLNAAQLQHILDGVVRGLIELRETRGRAHGGLKPSNIILVPGDLIHSPVFLTDPAHHAHDGEAGDLHALGGLLHQLVTHRPFAGEPTLPSEEWEGLGRNARRWRELCEALLAPRPEDQPTLDDVAWQIRRLGGRSGPRLPRRSLLITGGVAAAIVIAVGVIALLNAVSLHALTQARRQWADPLAVALQEPQRRVRYEADPDLRAAIEQLDQADGLSTATTIDIRSLLSVPQLLRTHAALARLQAAKDDLSGRWHLLSDLEAMRRRDQSRGWNQPAEYLADLTGGARVEAGRALPAGIDRLLKVDPILHRQEPGIETAWSDLDAAATRLERTGDRTLVAFAAGLRASAGTELRLSDDGFHGVAPLESERKLAVKLAAAIGPNWPAGVDAQRLAQDLTAGMNLAHPIDAEMRQWLAALPLYAIRTPDTSRAAAALRDRLKEVGQAVTGSDPSSADAGAFDVSRRRLASRIDVFGSTPFVTRDFNDGTFESRRAALDAEVQSLRQYIRPRSAAEVLAGLSDPHTASPAIRAYWDRWKRSQAADPRMRTPSRSDLAMLRERSRAMIDALTEIDHELPAVPGSLSRTFQAVASERREREIGAMLADLDARAPAPDMLRLTSAAAGFRDWLTQLDRFSADFPIRRQFLMFDDRPDAKWADAPTFWNDPLIQRLVKPDLERLAAIRTIADLPRADLVRTARESDQPEIAFEAWRRLGLDGTEPRWPSGADELATERDLRARLTRMIGGLSDPGERVRPGQLLAEQGPVRWRTAVADAREESTLASAWRDRGAFGVDASQIAPLPAEGRFNLGLFLTRQALAGNDPAELQRDADQLVRSAVDLKTPASEQLAAAITRPVEQEPFGNQNPGDRFSVRLLGTGPPTEFRRIEPGGDARPFYLAVTDVSLGQFIAVVDAAHAWEECRRLPWSYSPGSADPRRGPRVWEWTAGLDAKLAPPQLWLAHDEDNDFAPPLRAQRFNREALSDEAGGMPSLTDPMQYVSAVTALWFARLCDCRLPAPEEWEIAWTRYGRQTPPDQLNLRDLSWEIQRQYAAGGVRTVRGSWPFEDVFVPTELSAGAALRTTGRNDGTLLFRPVNSGGGSIFHHLAGNVAQYVCMESDQTRLPRNASSQVVNEFVRQRPGSLFVIGGSAFSSPDMPMDKPLPVSQPAQSWCDVGFRLAFSAPPRSLAEKLRWVLKDQRYLWSPAVAVR